MENHFLLCGLGRIGARVLDYLRAAGAAVVVIDNRCAAADPRLGGAPLVSGDCRQAETLEKAGLAQARGVLILTSDDLINISTALMVRHLQADVRVVVRMFNQNLIARLGPAVPNVFALSTSALTAPLLALIARTGEAVGTFRLEDGRRFQVAEVSVAVHSPLVGRSLDQLAAEHRCQIVACLPPHNRPEFLHEVKRDRLLQPGDRLALCGEPQRLAPLLSQAENESLPELLWAGFVRRQWRVLRQTLREVDLPVKICTAVFVAVIVVSVLVFHFGMRNDTLIDAFYRTISLMATGADMRGNETPAGSWQKAYISSLRLIGAALTAAFTAILTNYLVRAHLGGALEVRRIPDKGHIIVCGLGNVGFRLVEDLLAQGERVVAIERARDNPFIPTARRLGVAVIVGDATIPEVLRQAHAPTARAVIVATSNELVNLEVALLVREFEPSPRVVLRLTDPQLARTLREAADVRLAFSIPELAAPAFVAALFGDRVRSVFLIEGRLLMVVDLVAQVEDALLVGQAVLALAVDYQFLPIALFGPEKKGSGAFCRDGPEGALQKRLPTPFPHPLQRRLEVGDRLTVIIALGDLQRLLQREQVPHDYAVDVTACPLPARAWVVQLLQRTQNLSAQAAAGQVATLPIRVGRNLTHGQAEDLLFWMGRERITGILHRLGEDGEVQGPQPS